MDKIFFNKMAFYAYHGAFSEENRLGQRFYVDLELGLDFTAAGRSDDLGKTVDYGKVYETVNLVEKPVHALLETLAENIADPAVTGLSAGRSDGPGNQAGPAHSRSL